MLNWLAHLYAAVAGSISNWVGSTAVKATGGGFLIGALIGWLVVYQHQNGRIGLLGRYRYESPFRYWYAQIFLGFISVFLLANSLITFISIAFWGPGICRDEYVRSNLRAINCTIETPYGAVTYSTKSYDPTKSSDRR